MNMLNMHNSNELQTVTHKEKPTTLPKSINSSLALNHDLANSASAYLKPRESDQVKSDDHGEQASSSQQRSN